MRKVKRDRVVPSAVSNFSSFLSSVSIEKASEKMNGLLEPGSSAGSEVVATMEIVVPGSKWTRFEYLAWSQSHCSRCESGEDSERKRVFDNIIHKINDKQLVKGYSPVSFLALCSSQNIDVNVISKMNINYGGADMKATLNTPYLTVNLSGSIFHW